MPKVKSFTRWITEALDVDRVARLVDLGMAEDKPPMEWVVELLDGHPDLRVVPVFNPANGLLQIKTGTSILQVAVHNGLGTRQADGFAVSEFTQGGDRVSSRSYKLGPGLENLEVATRIVKTLEAAVPRPVRESEDPESLQRLIDLGLVEDRGTTEWIEYLLQGDPEFYHWPVMTTSAYNIRIDNKISGSAIQVNIIGSGEPDDDAAPWRASAFKIAQMVPHEPGRAVTDSKKFPLGRDLSNLQIAVEILSAIRSEYSVKKVTESEDPESLQRLIDLGLVEDKTPIYWIEELLTGDPEWDPMPAMNPRQHQLKIYNKLAGGHVQLAIDCYFGDAAEESDFGEPTAFVVSSSVSFVVTNVKTYEIPEGLSHLQVARLIVDTLRSRYSASVEESLDRLVALGLAPSQGPMEWLRELLAEDPDFEVDEAGCTSNVSVLVRRAQGPGAEPRKNRVVLAQVYRELGLADTERPFFKFTISKLNPQGTVVTKSYKIPPGLSNHGIALLILNTLRGIDDPQNKPNPSHA